MLWNKHSELEGQHAIYGASQHAWLNDETDNDTVARYFKKYIPTLGTVTHEYAAQRIRNRIRMSRSDKNALINFLLEGGIPREVIDIDFLLDTVIPYVNDAIGFKMRPEQVLFYSYPRFFGTADAIDYNEKTHFVRIHDLKTGITPVSMDQLKIYLALFCLEYKIKPYEITSELRIYKEGQILVANPTVDEIVPIIDKIVRTEKIFRNNEE